MITAMSPEPSDEVVQRLYESLDEEMLLGATEVLLEEGDADELLIYRIYEEASTKLRTLENGGQSAHSIAERKAIVKSLQPYYSIELLTVFARQFDTTHSVTPAAREEPNQSSQPAPSSNAHMSHECSPDDVVETGSHCAEQSADDMEEDELDEDEFFVDRIVNHKGKGSGLKFLVKWKGYPDEDNTWEPLANVEENEKLYEYLEDHPELKDALTKSRAKAGRR